MKFITLVLALVFSSTVFAQNASTDPKNGKGVWRTGSGGYFVDTAGAPVISPFSAELRPPLGTSLIHCIDNFPDMYKYAAGISVASCKNTDHVGRSIAPPKK